MVKALMQEPLVVPAMSESTLSVVPTATHPGIMASSSVESSTISSMHASAVVDHADIAVSLIDPLDAVSRGGYL